MLSPGNYDPSIAVVVREHLWDARSRAPINSVAQQRHQSEAQLMHLQVMAMQRGGGNVPWWRQYPLASDEMTYECDAGLGSPKAMDCSQLQHQISARTDNVQIAAGEVNFLSTGK